MHPFFLSLPGYAIVDSVFPLWQNEGNTHFALRKYLLVRVERWILIALLIASGGGFLPCYGRRNAAVLALDGAVPRSALDEMQSLGELLGVSLDAVASPHFVVFHEGNPQDAREVCRVLEQARERFFAAFSGIGVGTNRSGQPLIWMCFEGRETFDRYAARADRLQRMWLASYYSSRTNRVALIRSHFRSYPEWHGESTEQGSTETLRVADAQDEMEVLSMPGTPERFAFPRLTHELAHQLAFNSGLQVRGIMYPFWVSEGLATNFEFEGRAALDTGVCSTVRLRAVLDAHMAGELVPLRRFLVEAHGPLDIEQSRRYYAQAWALFHFVLRERGEDLVHYLRTLAALRPGRRTPASLFTEFEVSFGSLESFDLAWNAHLDRQMEQRAQKRALTQAAGLRPTHHTP